MPMTQIGSIRTMALSSSTLWTVVSLRGNGSPESSYRRLPKRQLYLRIFTGEKKANFVDLLTIKIKFLEPSQLSYSSWSKFDPYC